MNIDHVATLRNARGGVEPSPLRAAESVARAGGDSVTAHLREDRRHIRDEDIRRIRGSIPLPLNLEMAATDEMVAFAVAQRPHAACIVPERREELTTEGGLDVAGALGDVRPRVQRLVRAGVEVALFIDPDLAQVEAASEAGATAVELHTGEYCNSESPRRESELARLGQAAERAG